MRLLDRFSSPRRLTIDSEAALGGEHARRTGRSWWALRFTDGQILHEWDRDGGSPSGHMDWPRLAMLERLRWASALRLFCPNGQMAELGGDGDQTGRLFQFKVAVRQVRLGPTSITDESRQILAHVIGIVTGFDGQCLLYAWEPLPEPLPPPGCPPVPRKPDYFNPEQPLWAVKEQDERYQAEQRVWQEFQNRPAVADWRRQCQQWEASGRGQLVGPIQDNVYEIAYQQVGRLNADHLGLADGEGR